MWRVIVSWRNCSVNRSRPVGPAVRGTRDRRPVADGRGQLVRPIGGGADSPSPGDHHLPGPVDVVAHHRLPAISACGSTRASPSHRLVWTTMSEASTSSGTLKGGRAGKHEAYSSPARAIFSSNSRELPSPQTGTALRCCRHLCGGRDHEFVSLQIEQPRHLRDDDVLGSKPSSPDRLSRPGGFRKGSTSMPL